MPVVRTDGLRAVYGHVITKFSGMGRFTYPWCSAGALCARELCYKYSDRCTFKNIIYLGQRRVIRKILAMCFFFQRGCFETQVKRNIIEFQPCFWLAKSTAGLETVFHVFLGNERIFRIKTYIAFEYLLRSTSMQKKSDFDFLSVATNRRFWSIFAWIGS